MTPAFCGSGPQPADRLGRVFKLMGITHQARGRVVIVGHHRTNPDPQLCQFFGGVRKENTTQITRLARKRLDLMNQGLDIQEEIF